MRSTNNDRQTAGELVPVKFSRLARRGALFARRDLRVPDVTEPTKEGATCID